MLGRQVLTADVKEISSLIGNDVVLPEVFSKTTITAEIDAGKHIFWLGLGHYYELGRDWAIETVLKDGAPAPAGSWSYPDQRLIGRGTAPLSTHENLTIINRTMANVVWWIKLNDTSTTATWSVTLRERWISVNPLMISTVKTNASGSTDFDVTARWLHSGGVSQGGAVHPANVNALAIWGIPEGYEIELWGIRLHNGLRSAGQARLQRARVWRPWLRIAPTERRSGMPVVILPEVLLASASKRILGVRLYNPATGARSAIRVIGPVSHNRISGKLRRFIHLQF